MRQSHTYTTNLLSNGAQSKDVQELLGHLDVSTTMNVYAHAKREAKRDSAKLLEKVIIAVLNSLWQEKLYFGTFSFFGDNIEWMSKLI